ncbi:MAG TPA: alkaline phosphatase PhoX [Thermoleophilaceae bacterium]|nr:alkaline phosphatase PhoX [Thermoleophilaceae bacterium]
MRRRDFIATGAGAAGALVLTPAFLREALAAPARAGASPYGPLLPADANGLALPDGFSGKLIARGQRPVGGMPWPPAPDGQAIYRTKAGGWILVTNSESPAATGGGASAIRFSPTGEIERAYRILSGTNINCAGGPTPWGTWLSCEEHEGGMVWEADPAGVLPSLPRPALGNFAHEAACVDRETGHVFLTEDQSGGGFYRFTPDTPEDLTAGLLEVASVGAGGVVSWHEVPDPNVVTGPAMTRQQVPQMTRFNGGEGLWFDDGIVYFTTKGDKKVWAYDARAGTIETIFDRSLALDSSLDAVDNITVSASGDVYVCEDGGNMEIGIITPGPDRVVAPFCRLEGEDHQSSEMCGAVFDPSGTRLYFTSQRAYPYVDGTPLADGAVYEVTGPFRLPAGGVPEEKTFGPPIGERALDLPADVPGLDAAWSHGAARIGLGEPARVHVALRTAALRNERSARWLEPRPVLTTLASASLDLPRGSHTVPLVPAARGIPAILTVRAGRRVAAVPVQL